MSAPEDTRGTVPGSRTRAAAEAVDPRSTTVDALALLRAHAVGDDAARRRLLARYDMSAASLGLLAAVVNIADTVGGCAAGSDAWVSHLDREAARVLLRDVAELHRAP